MSNKTPAKQPAPAGTPAPAGQPQIAITVIENPNVLTSYANLVAGLEFDGANFTLLFAHQRIAGTPQQAEGGQVPRQAHIAARITLAPVAAADLVNKLSGMMKQMAELQQKQQAAQSGAMNISQTN